MDEDGRESSVVHMPQLVRGGLESSDSEAKELPCQQERKQVVQK
jgi:hypothetical protein